MFVNRFKTLLLVVLVALALSTHGAVKRKTFVSVVAGSYDRRETVVSFALPDEVKGKSYALRDASGPFVA